MVNANVLIGQTMEQNIEATLPETRGRKRRGGE